MKTFIALCALFWANGAHAFMGLAPAMNDSGLTQETRLYYGKMTTGTSFTRNFLIDTYVRALMTAGTWGKTDVVYLHAANAEQTALLNLRNPGTYTATITTGGGTMTFSADGGFTGDGTSSYISSGFNPSTAGGLFALNDNHSGIWSGTNAQVDNAAFGNTNNFITPRNTSNNYATRNSVATTTSTANTGPTSIGYFAMSRSGSSGYTKYQSGAVHSSPVVTSTSLTNANLLIGGRSSSFLSTLQIRATKFGSSLSNAEQLDDYNALNAYLSGL